MTLQTANVLTDLVLGIVDAVTRTEIVATLTTATATESETETEIGTETETGAGQDARGICRTNAGIEMMTGTGIETEGSPTAIVPPEATVGIVTITGVEMKTVVKRGEGRTWKTKVLTASAGRKTEKTIQAIHGVRGGTVRRILTGGDTTGTLIQNVAALAIGNVALRKHSQCWDLPSCS